MSPRILPIVAATILSLACGALAQESQMVPGNIRAVKVDGTAWQTIGSQGQRQRLKEGDFLIQGNAVITSNDARVILLFQNGSTVDLQPGTKFSVDQFLVDPFDAEKIDCRTLRKEPTRSTTKLRVDDGTITAKVAKLKPASAYNIVTPLGTAGIRGTVVTVSVDPKAATFFVTEGMIQVTKNGQTFWVAEGAQQGQEGNQQGDTRTGTEGNEQTQTVIISTDPNYTPPAGQMQNLMQQGQNFSQTANQSIPDNAFAGAPQQQAGPGDTQPGGQASGEDNGGDVGGTGGGGGSAPALPGGFGGGGGGGGSSGGGGGGGNSGGGGQYSN